jgi:hypothetical protein
MSPKKKRPTEAQNLIDSLLDERTPTPHPETKTGTLKVVTSQLSNESDDHAPLNLETDEPNHAGADQVTVTRTGSQEPSQALHLENSATRAIRLAKARGKSYAEYMESTPVAESDVSSSDIGDSTLHNTPVSFPNSEVSDKLGYTQDQPLIDRVIVTEVKTAAKFDKKSHNKEEHIRPATTAPSSQGFASAEAALKQSDSLRIAQSHISELEQELEKMRRENEQLATAGETLRRRSDELLSKAERLDIQFLETKKIAEEEKKVLRSQLQHKDRESLELRGRLEEIEGRLESNFKKIRVRERELEHRLEIVRAESATLVSSKDKMILDLKRQIDQLTHENEFGKNKSQELFNQYKGKQDTIRRVVRALRIALTILEGDEDSGSGHDEVG